MKLRLVTSIAAFWLLLSLTGAVADPQQTTTPAPPRKLEPGDLIYVRLDPTPSGEWGDRQFRVLPDGRIYFPQVGELVVTGKTLAEVADLIQRGLAAALLNHRVTVELVKHDDLGRPLGDHKPVFVRGAVRRPMMVRYQGKMSLAKALTEVGGATKHADLRRITIRHLDRTSERVDLTVRRSGDILLRPGDWIEVPERSRPQR